MLLGSVLTVAAATLSILGLWHWGTRGEGLPLAFSGDAYYVWLTAQSLAFDLDLDLTNQYARYGDPWGLGSTPAADGWRFPPREIGPALLMVPGLWLGGFLGTSSPMSVVWACAPTACALVALGWICWSISRRAAAWCPGCEDWEVLISAAATLGFIVPFYSVGPAGYAHAPDAVATAFLVLLLLERRPGWQCGLAFAVCMLFRLQNALWLVWPVMVAWRADRADRGVVLRWGTTILGLGGLGVLPQVVLALRHPGSSAGSIRWTRDFFDLDHLGGDVMVVLVGEHGLLRFTPLVAVALGGAVLGLVAMMRHRLVSPLRLAGGASLLWLGLQVLLVAMVRDPDGGWAYGARRFAGVSGLLPIWMFLGVAAFRRRWPRETETGRLMDRCFRVLVVVAIIANLLTTWLALRGDLSLMPAS